MAHLRVGSKSPVFVTHVEFSDGKCMAFCQIGDVASQADTVAERVAEVSDNGSAPALQQASVGSLCLALFHEDNSWYRARIVRISGQTLTVFFIDYGNTEHVSLDNVLEAPEYVLAIPALSTKCIVSDCTPIRDHAWTEEEKKKIETMLVSGEFTLEIVSIDSSDRESIVYTVKLFNLDAPNTPVFVRPASSISQSLPLQSLKVGQTYQVYVSHVDSSKLFWVQLVSTEDELNSLMADIAACFAEDLPSTGDLVNAKNDQVCAACFTEDGAFYRGVVQNLRGDRCTVLYIDYGNHESKSTSELFTLPHPLCKSPRLAVQCSYKVSSNADSVEKMLSEPALADQVSTLTVVSATTSGYVVEIDSIEKILNPSKKPTKGSSATNDQKGSKSKMSVSYPSTVLMVDSTYDVCLSHVESPSNFFVQLLGKASDLDSLMEAIDQVAHNAGRLTNCTPGVACLAQFSDEAWYRGEVIAAQGGTSDILAVDFGFVETLGQNGIRAIESKFGQFNAQSVQCSIDLSTNDSSWTPKQIERFKALIEKSALVAHVSSKKGHIYQVDLYDTCNDVDRKLNEEFLKVQSQPVQQIKQQPLSPRHQPRLVVEKKTVLPPPEVTPGSKVTVCITALKMPVIFGQLTHTPVEKVAKLQTDLNTFCEQNTMETLPNPCIGAVCCTKYVDGGWYRGIVTSLQGNKVEVAFADFGDGVMKSVGDVKTLSDKLCELPQQCIQCMVDNLPTAPTEKLEQVLVNKRVEVLLKKKEEGPFPTFAVDITSRNILDQLQDRPASTGFKGAGGQGGFRSSDGGQRGFQRASPSSREGTSGGGFGGGGRSHREDRAGSLGRQLSGDGGFTQQDVGIQSTQQVMVTYVKDPSNFQVVLDQMNESLDLVMDRLHEYYSKLAPDADCLENPQLGKPCVAKFSEDKDWYRAVITGLRTRGQAEVRFVDYGNNDYTEIEGLKVIKPQFMALPAQAVQCSLADVAPTQGFWTPEQTVKFEEMVVEQSFKAKFRSQETQQGEVVYKLDLVDKAGTNVNKTFGDLTNTACVETSSSRSFSTSGMGADMKITVSTSGGDSGWDENGDTGSSFGKQRSFGGGRSDSGFGSSGPKTGFGGSGSRSGGGFDSGGGSSGGFGDSRKSGFGGSSGFGGGDARSGGGGFGKSDDGAGFGSRQSSDSSGFGSSRGFGGGGGGGGNKDCFKCGEAGHFSRECPNAASKGGGGGSRDCFKCGEGGHMARDCPNPPKGGAGGGRDCFKCGEAGHMARDCPNPQKAGGGGGRDCFKCGQPGHMARDCPNPESQGGQRRGGDRSSGFGARGGGGGSGFGSNSESGGFGSRGGGFGGSSGGGGGGFGQKSSEDWGSGGTDAGASSNRGGGFGSKGGFGGKQDSSGFGQKNSNDWGSTDTRGGGDGFGNKPSGGFGGNKIGGFQKSGGGDGFGKTGGFGKTNTSAASEDDWGSDTVTPAASFGQKEPSPIPAGKSRFRGVSVTDDSSASMEQFSTQNLDVGQSINVYIVFTTNPDDFYCQVIEKCTNLEELMAEMNSFYEKLSDGEMLLGNTRKGQPCAAKFSDDNMWYRAEILSAGQNDVDVLFVDYGNSETVSVQKLRKLKPDFLKLNRQGLKCGLDGITAVNNSWSDKAIEDFEDLTMEKELVAKIVSRKSDSRYVMDVQNIDEKINIGETLCEKGHCSFGTLKASPAKDEIVTCPYPGGDIEVGREMDVYVSWIENPDQFWVQPVNQESHLLELVDKIQEMYTEGPGSSLPVTSVATGQAVVAPFSEDEAWYRGYVEKMEGSKCKVRFTDYGNTDMVEREQLRAPLEDLLKEPAQATHCRLKGVRPLQTGVWTTDAKDIMDSLVKDAVVKCKVVDVTKGCLVVDVTSGDCDIGKELIKAAVVRAEKEESPVESQKVSPVKMLRYRGGVQLAIGGNEAAYVTNTDSVANFWCQLVRSSSQLEDVMAQLESYCQSGTGLTNFPVGFACGAKYSEDESWYRAKVTAAYPDSIEVLFVDYGNTEKVPLADLCALTEDLVDLEPQAVQCELDSASKASNQLTEKFIEMTADQEVMLTICDIQDDAAVVRVVLPDGRDVGELLGLSQASANVLSTAGEKRGSGLAETGGRKDNEIVYPAQSVPADSAAAFVGHTENGVIYLQLVCEEDSLNSITETIQELEACPSLDIKTVKVGDAVCGRFSEDQSWYRAVVKSIEDESVNVQFVDYGNCDKINQSTDLRSLPEDLLSKQPLAYACKLTGFTNLSDEQEEIFIAATTDKELSVTFMSNSPVFDVELLDENEKNLVSLFTSKPETDGQLDEDGISQAVEEVLQAESEATVQSSPGLLGDLKTGTQNNGDEPVSLEAEVEQLSISDTAEEVLARLYDVKASNKVGSYGYKLRDLSVDEQDNPNTSVVVTSVNTPADFWCRIQDSTYHYHQDLLQENYREEREQLANVKEGERCVVHLNDEYHRAAITEIGDDGISVLLVDTGDLRHNIVADNLFTLKPYLEEYPQLAFHCALTGVLPRDGGDTWTKEAGDVFKSLLLELDNAKDLPASAKATIVTEEEGLTFLELTVDRKDVGESLVENEIATVDDLDDSKNESRLDAGIAEDFGEFGNVQLEVGSEVNGVVVDCDNLYAIVFHTLDGADSVLEITEVIAEYVENKTGGEDLPEELKPGPCLAKCPDDDLWYRASLTAVTQSQEEMEEYQVFLVDYGSSFALTRPELLSIPDELLTQPGQAVICRLDEVEPIELKWNSDCHEMVNEYVADGELMVYVGSYEEGIHRVMLSKVGEPTSLNKTLVEVGMAAAVLGSQLEMSLLTDDAEISFNEMSLAKQDSFGNDLDTTGGTESDLSAITEVDTTGCTEGDLSAITDVDTSVLTEADTSCMTEADTSCMTEADTSCMTEADTSCMTEADTSCMTEADTSCMTEADTSCMTEAETSCMTEADTSGLPDTETSLTEEISDGEETNESDTDSKDPVVMEPGRDKDAGEIPDKYRDEIAEKHLVELHVVMNIPKPELSQSDESLADELAVDNVESSSESSLMKEKSCNLNHDKKEQLKEESDIDDSFFLHKGSPTGYTTSELDTTDLRDIETTESADYDSCLSTTDLDNTNKCRDTMEQADSSHVAHKRKLSDETDATVKKIKIIEQDEQLEKSSDRNSNNSNNVNVDLQEFSSGLETTGCESEFSFNACAHYQNSITEDPHTVSNDQLESEETENDFERVAHNLIDKIINGVIAQEENKMHSHPASEKERIDTGVCAMKQVTNNNIGSAQTGKEIINVGFCLEVEKEKRIFVEQPETAIENCEIVTLLDICTMETAKNTNANQNANNNNENTDTASTVQPEESTESNQVGNETIFTDSATEEVDTHQIEQQYMEIGTGKISEVIENKEIEPKSENESTEGNMNDVLNAETDQTSVKLCSEINDMSVPLDTESMPYPKGELYIDDIVNQITCQYENGTSPSISKGAEEEVVTGNLEPTCFVKNENDQKLDLNGNGDPKEMENELIESKNQGGDSLTMNTVPTEQEKQELIRLVVDTVKSNKPETTFFEVELKKPMSDVLDFESNVQSETAKENNEKLFESLKEQKYEECDTKVAVPEDEDLVPVIAESTPSSRINTEDLNDQKSECDAEVTASKSEELMAVVEENTPVTPSTVYIEDMNGEKPEESDTEVAASENKEFVAVDAEGTSVTPFTVNIENLKDGSSKELNAEVVVSKNEESMADIKESTPVTPSTDSIEDLNEKSQKCNSEVTYANNKLNDVITERTPVDIEDMNDEKSIECDDTEAASKHEESMAVIEEITPVTPSTFDIVNMNDQKSEECDTVAVSENQESMAVIAESIPVTPSDVENMNGEKLVNSDTEAAASEIEEFVAVTAESTSVSPFTVNIENLKDETSKEFNAEVVSENEKSMAVIEESIPVTSSTVDTEDMNDEKPEDCDTEVAASENDRSIVGIAESTSITRSTVTVDTEDNCEKSKDCVTVAALENEESIDVTVESTPSEDWKNQSSKKSYAEVVALKNESVALVAESTLFAPSSVNMRDLNDQKSEECDPEIAASENEELMAVIAESKPSRIDVEDMNERKSEGSNTEVVASENEELDVVAKSIPDIPSRVDIEDSKYQEPEECCAEVTASEKEQSIPGIAENTPSRVNAELVEVVDASGEYTIEVAGNVIGVTKMEVTDEDVVVTDNRQDYCRTSGSIRVSNSTSAEQEHGECMEVEYETNEDKAGDFERDQLCHEDMDRVHNDDDEGDGLTATDQLHFIQMVADAQLISSDSTKELEQYSVDVLSMADRVYKETSCQSKDEIDIQNNDGLSDIDLTCKVEAKKLNNAGGSEGDSIVNSELCLEDTGNARFELTNNEMKPLLTELDRGEYIPVEKVNEGEIQDEHEVDGEQLKEHIGKNNVAEEKYELLGTGTNDSTDVFLKISNSDKNKQSEGNISKEFKSSETSESNVDKSEKKEDTQIEIDSAEIHCGLDNEIYSFEQSEKCTEDASNNPEMLSCDGSKVCGDPDGKIEQFVGDVGSIERDSENNETKSLSVQLATTAYSNDNVEHELNSDFEIGDAKCADEDAGYKVAGSGHDEPGFVGTTSDDSVDSQKKVLEQKEETEDGKDTSSAVASDPDDDFEDAADSTEITDSVAADGGSESKVENEVSVTDGEAVESKTSATDGETVEGNNNIEESESFNTRESESFHTGESESFYDVDEGTKEE